MPKSLITSLRLLPGSMTACFDASGKQLPQLQTCLLADLAERAETQGHNLDGVLCETAEGNWRLVKGKDGKWNLEAA